jgi:regulator of protease activity HflC (stomatin/prohibitin superfamily)
MNNLIAVGVAVAVVLFLIAATIKVVPEYQRGVIFRLGRLIDAKGPGLILLIPIVDRIVRVDLRTLTMEVPPQEIITKDNVSAKVNAVAYFKVVDPSRAIVEVENYVNATSQIAQTTLRSVLGQADLDHLLTERDKINARLQEIIDEQTEPWGIKVSVVEIKDVEIPSTMQRAMARQAEAERERRAKVIAAEGEFQASERLSQAAVVLDSAPTSITLRYLQTLVEVAAEKNSTTIFPIPIDLLAPFMRAKGWTAGEAVPPTPPADTLPAPTGAPATDEIPAA